MQAIIEKCQNTNASELQYIFFYITWNSENDPMECLWDLLDPKLPRQLMMLIKAGLIRCNILSIKPSKVIVPALPKVDKDGFELNTGLPGLKYLLYIVGKNVL